MQNSFTEKHNVTQRSYFESVIKPTMIPVDTPYIRRQVDALVGFAGLRPGDRILEVGCGMGRYTLPLRSRGIVVEGLDLSQVLLDRLRAFAGEGAELVLHAADVAAPPEELEGRFDHVIGFFMLHHLHDMESCFRGMAKMLKPGGRASFLEPNAFNPLYYLQIAITPGMTWEGDGGIVDMRRGKVGGALARAGFDDYRLSRFGFFPPFITNQRWGAAAERVLESFPPFRPFLPFQLFGGRRA